MNAATGRMMRAEVAFSGRNVKKLAKGLLS